MAQTLHLRQVPAPSLATTRSPWENELSELETVIMTLCFLPAWASTGLSSAVGNIYLLQVRTLTSPGDSCRA